MSNMQPLNLEEQPSNNKEQLIQEGQEPEMFLGEPLPEEESIPQEEELLKPLPETKPSNKTQERIRKVIAERNASRQETEIAKAEAFKWQKAAIDGQKAIAESQKDLLKRHINSVKALMKKAHTESDSESLVQLTGDLNDAQVKLMALEQWVPQEMPKEVQQAPKPFEQTPEELQDWVSRNSWFQAPKTARDQQLINSAVALYDLLIADGHDPEDKDFYNVMDQRLGLKVASQPQGSVELNKSPMQGKALTQRPGTSVPRQTVQGASRQPLRPSGSQQQYVPNAREKRMMNILNVKEKDFVKEAQKIQKAKEQGRNMVTLFDEDQ